MDWYQYYCKASGKVCLSHFTAYECNKVNCGMLLLSLSVLLKKRTLDAQIAIPVLNFALPSISARGEFLLLLDVCRKLVKYFGCSADLGNIFDFIDAKIVDWEADCLLWERYLRLLLLLPDRKIAHDINVNEIWKIIHKGPSDSNDSLY